MSKKKLTVLPPEILEQLIRRCAKCSHEWMPKIKIDGKITHSANCPNPECGSSKWDSDNI